MEEKNKLAEENNAAVRRYKYISEVAKREFGISTPKKRKFQDCSPNPNDSKENKIAQNSFDGCMQGFRDTGDDEEIFSATVKRDLVKPETKLEWHTPKVLASEFITRPRKRLNRPRPKIALIKKEAENIHSAETHIKEELLEDRTQLATPSLSPEFDLTNQTHDTVEVASIVDDTFIHKDKEVKREDCEASSCQKVRSSSDLGTEDTILDIDLDETVVNELPNHFEKIT